MADNLQQTQPTVKRISVDFSTQTDSEKRAITAVLRNHEQNQYTHVAFFLLRLSRADTPEKRMEAWHFLWEKNIMSDWKLFIGKTVQKIVLDAVAIIEKMNKISDVKGRLSVLEAAKMPDTGETLIGILQQIAKNELKVTPDLGQEFQNVLRNSKQLENIRLPPISDEEFHSLGFESPNDMRTWYH